MKKKIYIGVFLIVSLVIIYVSIGWINLNSKNMEYKAKKFDLRNKININTEYQIQDTYKSCYAYAGLDTIETYILLNYGKEYNFSEAHVEYMTSNLFYGTRNLNSGGNVFDVINYINSGNGPALESEVPNKVYEKEDLKLLENKAYTIIKKITPIQYEKDTNVRENIKKYVAEKGALSAGIYFEPLNTNLYNKSTYSYINLTEETENHVVTIIGWDDNYSKENFPISNRPKDDGAYIVMAYWKETKNDNIMYISYEDILIEKYTIGIDLCELY